MAKKSQSGNKSTPNLYENFHPMSEWKEEPENNILHVYLPDFGKEQIHIACVRSSRIVRVTAERQVGDSKWRGCNEAFPIPENCKLDKIHAKWQNGTLTITMPKETVTTQPQIKTTQIELESPKPVASNDHQKAASPKAAAEHQPKYEKISDDQMKRDKQADHDEKKKSFGAFPKAAAAAAAETKPQNVEQVAKKEVKTATEKKGFKAAAGDDDDDDGKKDGIAGKTKKELEKKSRTAAAMKAVKEMAMEQKEDKQLMINMGAAVLVILALGAYVSYSIGSKSKD